MKLIKSLLPEPALVQGFAILPDEVYMVEDQTVGQYALFLDGQIKVDPVNIPKFKVSEDTKEVVIMRAGGAGDILFCTPLIRFLKARYPKLKISFCTFECFEWILKGHEVNYIPWPMTLKEAFGTKGREIIDLEHLVEKERERHVVDVFLDAAGISNDDPTLKRCEYFPTLTKEEATEFIPNEKGLKRIGVQWEASSPVRTYPKMEELCMLLKKEGYQVCLLGAPGAIQVNNGGTIINCTDKGWSWQQATDFLQSCDVVIGPDSSVIHFAGAMRIPAIGLYGSFPWKLRTAYHPSVTCLQATGECSPCFWHGARGQLFPPGWSCNKARKCTVLDTISPTRVLQKVKQILDK